MPAIYSLPKSGIGLILFFGIFVMCFIFIDVSLFSIGAGLLAIICTLLMVIVLAIAWQHRNRELVLDKKLVEKGYPAQNKKVDNNKI